MSGNTGSTVRRSAGVGGLLVGALLMTACSSPAYTDTAVPAATQSSAATGSGATATPAACDNATQSYDPLPGLTGSAADAAVQAIRDRGLLRAGVSADSYQLGSRNPVTGQIEGFDIDMVHAIAKAILGDENKVQLVVIQSGDRIPVLQKDTVDVVVRNMTMTCSRWNDIAFSAEYFRSGLKILVRKGSDVTTLAGLSGKKVCAPNNTSTMDVVRATAGVQAVGAATHTGCLVLFQQGKVDAIAGDDTVLAGLAAQDPYAVVPEVPAVTAEPYGVGVRKERVDLVRYINKVLADYEAGGGWKTSYDKWFAADLGPAPQPPVPSYGRSVG